MRVMQVNVQIGSGSAGTIVVDLYKGIITNGDECQIAYSRGGIKGIPVQNTIKIGNKWDLYFHVLYSRLFGRTASYSKIETMKFLKKVDEYKPDIIHIHGIYGYYINMELFFEYIRNHNIKLVTTLHSCWDFTGHCCYFDSSGCMQWKNQCDKCPQKWSYPKSLFFEDSKKNLETKIRLYHQIDDAVLVSPSEWMDGIVSQSNLKDIKHIVIHNGVDLNKFGPHIDMEYINSLGINKDWPTILSVASLWDRRKGLKDIYEMANIYQTENINFVVVGLSAEQIKKKPRRIIGIKRTENLQQLISLYTFSTVLFNPTYEDNYPTVNLESIACNTPVITYDTGGSGEIVLEYKMGTVVNKKDYEKVLSATFLFHKCKPILDEQLKIKLSSESMIHQYYQLYKTLENSNHTC